MISIGLIGVGGICQVHLKNLVKMSGVQIAAVCDIDPHRAQEVGKQLDATPYTRYRNMLRREHFDACYVCLTPSVHGTIEYELAEAQIPFFVEKPVHLKLEFCEGVLNEVDKHNLITAVGYHWRYMDTTKAVKAFIAKRRITAVDGGWQGAIPEHALWWPQMKLSGGQLVEQATHIVDLARYLAGDIDTVFASGTKGAFADIDKYDIYDASLTNLQFDSGAVGVIATGCVASGTVPSRVGLTVSGRGWQADVKQRDGQIIHERGKRKLKDNAKDIIEQIGRGDAAFIHAVKTGKTDRIRSTYRDATQTLAVTLAANESMRTGEPATVERFM